MSLPVEMRPAFARLPVEAQYSVQSDYDRRRKSKTFAYVAWFFLGWHYLYLRRVGLQFAFWLTAGGLGVWWLVDLFRVGPLVNRLNEDTFRDLLLQYRAIYQDDRAQYQPVITNVMVDGRGRQDGLSDGGTGRSQPSPSLIDSPSFLQPSPAPSAAQPLIAAQPENSVRYVPDEQASPDYPYEEEVAPRRLSPVLVFGIIVALLGAGGLWYYVNQTSATSQAVLGIQASYKTTRQVNVRSAPYSSSSKSGSIDEGVTVVGTAQLGPNKKARWVKVEQGPFTGGYISTSNLMPVSDK